MLDANSNFHAILQNSGNYLLVKDDVGKAKPSVRNLPQKTFTYGRATNGDREGVGKLLSSWQTHQTPNRQPLEKNLKAINAKSAGQGYVTAKQTRQFRQLCDIRLQSANKTGRNGGINQSFDFSYGKPSRPSTPMRAVLGNLYNQVEFDQKNESYWKIHEQSRLKSAGSARRSTRGFDKMTEAIKNSLNREKKAEFKMQKFQKVKPRTNTNNKGRSFEIDKQI